MVDTIREADTMSTMADTKAKRTRRSFTEDYKTGAVRLVLDEGKTVAGVARDLGLTESSLRNWVEHARAELVRLRKELRIVQEEREILKKASIRSPSSVAVCA